MSNQQYLDTRMAALLLGDRLYRGKPCARCGSTARYTNGRMCVACAKAQSRLQYAPKRKQREVAPMSVRVQPQHRGPRPNRSANRDAALIFGDLTYQGQPCRYCGGTERYTSAHSCARHCRRWRRNAAALHSCSSTNDASRSAAACMVKQSEDRVIPTYLGKPCQRCRKRERCAANSLCTSCLRQFVAAMRVGATLTAAAEYIGITREHMSRLIAASRHDPSLSVNGVPLHEAIEPIDLAKRIELAQQSGAL